MDKKHIKQNYIDYLYVRTANMFNYEGLPDSIPEKTLELMLQKNGRLFFYEHEGTLYALKGTLAGELNQYDEFTEINLTVPYLKLTKTVPLDAGVLITNDSLGLGLDKLFTETAELVSENTITMLLTTYNQRIVTLLSTADDNTKESANKYLEQIIEGKLGIVAENRFFEGIKVHSNQTGTSNHTTQQIELQQYLKASLYNDIGIQTNFNMKRERLTSNETEMNDEIYPLVDDMLSNRELAIEKINDYFGLDITVTLGSIWKKNRNKVEKEIDEPAIEPTIEPAIEPTIEPDIEPDTEPIIEEINEPTIEPDIEEIIEELELVIDELEVLEDEV